MIGRIRVEVAIQKVRRNVEGVVAVPLSADCFAIACRAAVVILYFFDRSTRMPFSRINRPTIARQAHVKHAAERGDGGRRSS